MTDGSHGTHAVSTSSRNTRSVDALGVIGYNQSEIANAMTEIISADMFATNWIVYALSAIAVIVTVCLLFIIRKRMS